MTKLVIEENRLSAQALHIRYLDENGQCVPFDWILASWSQDTADGESVRAFHTETLRSIPFEAFKWETPVMDDARRDRPFEFVALSSPSLARAQSSASFAEQFETAGDDEVVLTFPNLGHSALMVVPTPQGPRVDHCHLGSFLRSAPARATDHLWRAVGTTMIDRISNKPVWLSTAGGGVPWLHVRLDDRPKYYGYRPYRDS